MARKRLMTSGEAARYIGVSGAYINALIHKGRLKAERTPLGFLIDPESVEAFKRERDAKLANQRPSEPKDDAEDSLQVAVSA